MWVLPVKSEFTCFLQLALECFWGCCNSSIKEGKHQRRVSVEAAHLHIQTPEGQFHQWVTMLWWARLCSHLVGVPISGLLALNSSFLLPLCFILRWIECIPQHGCFPPPESISKVVGLRRAHRISFVSSYYITQQVSFMLQDTQCCSLSWREQAKTDGR